MTFFSSRQEKLSNHIIKVVIDLDENPISYGEVVELWQQDAEFRSFFINLLANSPFSAFRWETPPLTTHTLTRIFEFVLLNSPHLDRTPDPNAFAEYFCDRSLGEVVEFFNLGGDAILIVPCPQDPWSEYSQIGGFLQQAPESQKHALWKQVGSAMKRRISTQPVWLSTAGGGVPWLHVRLDNRPKYYGYQPYRDPSF